MALRCIVARFECDTCGKSQEVYMDPALETTGTLSDAAEYSAKEDLLDVEIDEDSSKFTCGYCLRKRNEEEDE